MARSSKLVVIRSSIALRAAIACQAACFPARAAEVDFQRDIRPILAEHCFQCHSPDKAEAGLRLDQAATIGRKLESGTRAIVPGNVTASAIIPRIQSDDPGERMPAEKPPLSIRQKQLLNEWIQQGASWGIHWAYRPLVTNALPITTNRAWLEDDIDRSVLPRLAQEHIQPSRRATHYTLIRRLYCDLLGLLLSSAEVERFMADRSPDAYVRLVDRILGSPRFGERWGRH